ncbi:MAG: tRNA (5-methylaminomethyl-2-thiouridine)(34)-methyltransferase MnmD [Alphaproteobacteria bacterium]
MDTSDKGAPRSKEFDDVYFSAVDGLAEMRHVFLSGNDLPARFAEGGACFAICETGFGTGLNFLASWAEWLSISVNQGYEAKSLRFVSYEKFPLTRDEIEAYLTPFWPHFEELRTEFLAQYPQKPQDLRGRVELSLRGNVELILIFEDVNTALPLQNDKVDVWFLDGFKPSSNPDMWSETVFAQMARLSHEGATFATFTAAGFVKRGLMAAGFHVEKRRGFGRKRDMLVGRFIGQPDIRSIEQSSQREGVL